MVNLFANIVNWIVFYLWQLTVEGEFYHKSCFRCAHSGCFLTPSTYAALDGYLYCKPHFSQLFKEKGSYSYLSKQASLKKNEQEAAAEKTDDERPESEAETSTTTPTKEETEEQAKELADDQPEQEQ